jgi:hypothetical protein
MNQLWHYHKLMVRGTVQKGRQKRNALSTAGSKKKQSSMREKGKGKNKNGRLALESSCKSFF